jgi:hypothetical protein
MCIHVQSGTEPTIAMFQRFKTVHAVECEETEVGIHFIDALSFNIRKFFDLRY